MGSVVREFKPLRRDGSDDALRLLQRIASQVKPIMARRSWTVGQLCEFYPSNPSLLGCNINQGQKINLRLRQPHDAAQFLDYNDLLGTMLHELAHIVRGPHDATFYKILDDLNEELDDLIRIGYSGEGFFSNGQRIGLSAPVPLHKAKEQAANAALKRARLQHMMLPPGGVRLGSGSSSSATRNLSPRELAARAAERRQRDQVACGREDNTTLPSIPNSLSSKRRNPDPPVTLPSAKKPKPPAVIIDLVQEQENWACTACTFQNPPLILACQMCLTEKPFNADHEDVTWSCPRCTLENVPQTRSCTACEFVLHS